MLIHTIPLSAIVLSGANPRTSCHPDSIEGLAASIKADGLLHNLVVSKVKGRKVRYRLISGERRYHALQLLAARGELPEDYAVPVSIRDGLSEDDTLRIATVENLQREQLPPLDEADALTKLARDGERLADLVAQTGLSETTIRRRLRLNHLCEAARAALRDGAITLAQAEALTLGDADRQRDIVEDIVTGRDRDPADIRDYLLDDKYPVELAVFPLERYTGTRTKDDLFDTAEYFDDAEQFWELQRQAVAELAEQHAETAEWVEVTEEYHVSTWQYRDAEEGETGGVLINLAPGGKVTVAQGLVMRAIDPRLTQKAPEKPKPAYSTVLCRYIDHHKSMAVQCRLLSDPRKAKEVAAVSMLGAADGYHPPMRLARHDCVQAFALSDNPPFSYRTAEREAQACVEALHLRQAADQAAWAMLLCSRKDAVTLYEAVKTLSDETLERLLLLLPVLCFGQDVGERLDTGDTLFNRVAQDLGMDMRAYWRPDEAFLKRRTLDQLKDIAREAGLEPSRKWRKSDLVTRLLRHFEEAHTTTSDALPYQQARDWLPDAMRFPAVDSSACGDTFDEDDALPEAA